MGKIVEAATKFVEKAAKTVGDVAGKVKEVASGVVSVAEKAMSFLSKPMEAITKPVKDLVGGALKNLPFGLDKVLGPIADKAIDGAASWLSGPVNAVVGLVSKALPTVKKIADWAETIQGVSNQVGALNNPQAQSNFQNQMAYAQGQMVN
ncbi:hypothetical protein [Hyalangium rubrum]|uniref:Uncharacterized protein n=1 Tax=Hyalangium rubrum TaxID=3103134 RepID=A0ABU5HEW6_9BACT|nr:hypothetical protein [Hyalangium sp. s54d21]MDY7231343.1 hypothetical protein [Hyalangium sp. s54d21]